MKIAVPLLALAASVYAETTVFTSTVTTTRDSSEAATAAIVDQETFIMEVLSDAFNDADRYQKVMAQQGMVLPPELIQFVAELKVQDTNTDGGIPTSFFAQRFPYTQFSTFIQNFPWVTTFYEDAGISGFRVPSDFMTEVVEEIITTTVDGSDNVSATSSVVASPSATTSTLQATTTSSIASTIKVSSTQQSVDAPSSTVKLSTTSTDKATSSFVSTISAIPTSSSATNNAIGHATANVAFAAAAAALVFM